MNWPSFLKSLKEKEPPRGLSPILLALWHEGAGNWDRAHDIAQEIDNADGSWIHAYLHRVEGDYWNAKYWYRKAGRSMPDYSLKQEWEELVKYFLTLEEDRKK